MADLGSKSGITSRQLGSNFQSFLGSKFSRSPTIAISAPVAGASSGFVGSGSQSLISLKPLPLAEQGREMRADSITLNSQIYNIGSTSNHVSSSGEEDRKVRIKEHSFNYALRFEEPSFKYALRIEESSFNHAT